MIATRFSFAPKAIFLEEMLNIEIKHGALFYGWTRRREDVVFDEELRLETEDAAKNVYGQYLSPTFARCAICVTL